MKEAKTSYSIEIRERKTLERVIYKKLLPIMEYKDGVSERQFDFHWDVNVLDVIKVVVNVITFSEC